MTTYDTSERIYASALAAFAPLYDAGLVDDRTEREVRDAFHAEIDHWLGHADDLDAVDIFDAVREAACTLGIPTEWTDY